MEETNNPDERNRSIELDSVFHAISEPLRTILTTASSSVTHPGTKGDASEFQWLNWLKTYLPRRYEVNKGFVIDSNGSISEQQDIIIYDAQYTPCLLNKDGVIYVPAESVYAIVEVKQELSRKYVKYAGDKIGTVRRLERTSAPIRHAGGTYTAKPPHRIIGGLVCLKSSWKSGIAGRRIEGALQQVKENSCQIDLICCLTAGSLCISYKKGKITLKRSTAESSLIFFFIKLISDLQKIGTVPAIDFDAYARTLRNYQET